MRPNVVEAVEAYCRLAREAGMTPTEMALRFVLDHELVASAVIGATSRAQLLEQLGAAGRPPMDEGLREAIDAVHGRIPSPTP